MTPGSGGSGCTRLQLSTSSAQRLAPSHPPNSDAASSAQGPGPSTGNSFPFPDSQCGVPGTPCSHVWEDQQGPDATQGQRATPPQTGGAHGPTPCALAQLMGGLQPQDRHTWELKDNGLQVTGHSRLTTAPATHPASPNKRVNTTKTLTQKTPSPIRPRSPFINKTTYFKQKNVFWGSPCLLWQTGVLLSTFGVLRHICTWPGAQS